MIGVTNLTFVSFYQQTSLHLAAKEGGKDTVKCLHDNGALTSQDKEGVSI